MKKTASILLAAVMLLSACVGVIPFASAAEASDTEIQPFYGLGWSAIDEKKFLNCDNLAAVGVRVNKQTSKVELYKDDVTLGNDVDKIVNWVKGEMNKRPKGARYLQVFAPGRAFDAAPEAVIYLDKGVDMLTEVFSAFMEKCSAAGVLLDGLIVDLEYIGLSDYYISRKLATNPLLLNEIVTHPQYATEVRPLLEERGFKFKEDPSEYTPEIWGVYNKSGEEYAQSRAIWNVVMQIRLSQYMNESMFEPLMQYYPDAVMSDYQTGDFAPWISGGDGGYSMKAGNTSNTNAYASSLDPKEYLGVFKKPLAFNASYYEDTPFHMFLYETLRFRAMYQATDTENISAWIAEYDYNAKRENSYSNTPYYTENVLHIGLLNPKPFLLYIYRNNAWFKTQEDYDARIQVVSEILEELTRVVGAADRKPISLPINYNSSFLLSGMYAGGRNVWRITPDTTQVSLEAFKVDGADPTFRVNGQSVTFPGGKIIRDGAISVVGTCGYWVETAKDVMPVITNDVDRYEKYPAALVDFEDYQLGAFDYNTAVPKNAWELKWNKKTATGVIQAQGDNQVLALTGSFKLQNQVFAKYVTAGDSYAKRQAWEVKVTIPEGLTAEAELILLDYAGSGKKADGGFKIAGGKLYYSEKGAEGAEYKELTDVSAGTYTLRRELDFSTEEAFTCNYIVYDGEGKELKAVNAVAVADRKLPVETLGLEVKDADQAVFLDDLKVAILGSVAELSLYEADFGIEVKDITQPQQNTIAYRLSWLNASGEAKTENLVAAFYQGQELLSETVIQEIKMLPGCDQLETGIVEVPEGQSVKVYLKSNAPADNNGNSTGENPGNTENAGDSGNTDTSAGWINPTVLAMGAAIPAAVIVIVLAIGKKSSKKAETEQNPETEREE